MVLLTSTNSCMLLASQLSCIKKTYKNDSLRKITRVIFFLKQDKLNTIVKEQWSCNIVERNKLNTTRVKEKTFSLKWNQLWYCEKKKKREKWVNNFGWYRQTFEGIEDINESSYLWTTPI